MERDVIIVGFGLAGLFVAERLQQRNQSVVVISDNSQRSSRVAGGLFNPILLKRFKLVWQADEQLPVALSFYRDLEKKLSASFLHMFSVLRRFNSKKEHEEWQLASTKAGLDNYIVPGVIHHVEPLLKANHGFGKVRHTGSVDTNALLDVYMDYLDSTQSMYRESFDYTGLELSNGVVQYKNIKAKKIVFCEGFGILKNPFFNWIKIQGNKGEYLIIKSQQLKLKTAIKSTIFIIPLGKDLYKVGATYERHDLTQTPSAKAKEYLVQELNDLINCEYEIVGQLAGIRPTVVDRKPVLGQHPKYTNLYCCNGFGSRGVLVGPSMSRYLVNNMLDGDAIPKELDVNRFY